MTTMTGDLFERAGIQMAAGRAGGSRGKLGAKAKSRGKKPARKSGAKPKPARSNGRKAAPGAAKAALKLKGSAYSAKDIEVLEVLDPLRRRPGMYIGGTDENAMHHLAAEVLDNAMDEAVAGHAGRIDVHLAADDTVTVT